MKKSVMLGTAVIAVLVLGAGGFGVARYEQGKVAVKPAATMTPKPLPTPSTLSYAGQDGQTALALLVAKDPKAGVKGTGANAYVTQINGYTASDAKKEYWALYVNGTLSNVGAGSYVSKTGDQLSWKIASY